MYLEKSLKTFEDFDMDPIYNVNLQSYTWRCELKQPGVKLQTNQDQDLVLTIENKYQRRYFKSNGF